MAEVIFQLLPHPQTGRLAHNLTLPAVIRHPKLGKVESPDKEWRKVNGVETEVPKSWTWPGTPLLRLNDQDPYDQDLIKYLTASASNIAHTDFKGAKSHPMALFGLFEPEKAAQADLENKMSLTQTLAKLGEVFGADANQIKNEDLLRAVAFAAGLNIKEDDGPKVIYVALMNRAFSSPEEIRRIVIDADVPHAYRVKQLVSKGVLIQKGNFYHIASVPDPNGEITPGMQIGNEKTLIARLRGTDEKSVEVQAAISQRENGLVKA